MLQAVDRTCDGRPREHRIENGGEGFSLAAAYERVIARLDMRELNAGVMRYAARRGDWERGPDNSGKPCFAWSEWASDPARCRSPNRAENDGCGNQT